MNRSFKTAAFTKIENITLVALIAGAWFFGPMIKRSIDGFVNKDRGAPPTFNNLVGGKLHW